METAQELLDILLAPATLFLLGKFILSKIDKQESEIGAIKQVLNGYGEQPGLLEQFQNLKKTVSALDRRKQ